MARSEWSHDSLGSTRVFGQAPQRCASLLPLPRAIQALGGCLVIARTRTPVPLDAPVRTSSLEASWTREVRRLENDA